MESRLRLLQIVPFLSLHGRLHQEQSARDQQQHAADYAQSEGPSEIIVGVSGHPSVLVPETGEYDDRQTAAETARKTQVTDDGYQLDVSLALRIAAQSEEQYQDERYQAQQKADREEHLGGHHERCNK